MILGNFCKERVPLKRQMGVIGTPLGFLCVIPAKLAPAKAGSRNPGSISEQTADGLYLGKQTKWYLLSTALISEVLEK
jgi:hypothetical protein